MQCMYGMVEARPPGAEDEVFTLRNPSSLLATGPHDPFAIHETGMPISLSQAIRSTVALFRHASFSRFLAVGAAGFLADAALLALLIRFGGFGPIAGRVISFLSAVVLTFVLN